MADEPSIQELEQRCIRTRADLRDAQQALGVAQKNYRQRLAEHDAAVEALSNAMTGDGNG